jgi:hypothetical protein
MDEADCDLSQPAPTNRLSVVASAAVAAAFVVATAFVGALGMADGLSFRIPRRVVVLDKAYDWEQFRKSGDNHGTLTSLTLHNISSLERCQGSGRIAPGVIVAASWNPAPARLAFNLNMISTAAASMTYACPNGISMSHCSGTYFASIYWLRRLGARKTSVVV